MKTLLLPVLLCIGVVARAASQPPPTVEQRLDRLEQSLIAAGIALQPIEPTTRPVEPTTQPRAGVPEAWTDANPIARWNVVPWQRVDEPFAVGVVAFALGDGVRVEFAVDGEPLATIDTPTLNPRTNTVEYWTTLDPVDFGVGGIELTATVTAAVARPLELTGPLTPGTVHNGVHALPLRLGDRASLTTRVLRAGPGREHATLTDALDSLPPGTRAGDVVLELDAGTYAHAGDSHRNGYLADEGGGGWLTIQAAPGVDRADVIIEPSASMKLPRVRWQGVTFTGANPVRGGEDAWVWLDGCHYAGPGLGVSAGLSRAANLAGLYVTDSSAADTRAGFTGAALIRGVVVGPTSGDPVGSCGFVVNAVVGPFSREGVPLDRHGKSAFHGDVWQHYAFRGSRSATDNLILYGVSATGWDSQGIFLQHPGNKHAGKNTVARFGGLALVDIDIQSVPGNAADSQLDAGLGAIYIRNWRQGRMDLRINYRPESADVAGLTVGRFVGEPLGTAATARVTGARATAANQHEATPVDRLVTPTTPTPTTPTPTTPTVPTTSEVP